MPIYDKDMRDAVFDTKMPPRRFIFRYLSVSATQKSNERCLYCDSAFFRVIRRDESA